MWGGKFKGRRRPRAVSSSEDPWSDSGHSSSSRGRKFRDRRNFRPNNKRALLDEPDAPHSSLQGYGMDGPIFGMNPGLQQQQGQDPSADPTSAAAAAFAEQWNAAAGGLNPFSIVGMDPNFLMGLTNFGQFGFMQGPKANPMVGSMENMSVSSDAIHLSNGLLLPPKPHTSAPITGERPPGCHTVFIGGLPDSCSEETIREIFSRCGEISTIRMSSKKNFCHVRFADETVVDNAIFFSGYHLRVGDGEEGSSIGRLIVDYAEARDDKYEWECRQRAMMREMRHKERIEQERFRPPSPPPVVHYSDHEASLLIEKLKGEETFQKASQILVTWLERGELQKRNSSQFYSMIQSVNVHVRRLMNEKQQYEDELNAAKQLLRQRVQGILIQFSQIEKVFQAASHQKVWDHFTKAQRKNLDIWRKQTEDTKNAQLEEVLREREEDEMDLSDDDDNSSPAKKSKTESGGTPNENLQESNELLHRQLEAYRNEVEVLKAESQQEKESLEHQIEILKAAVTSLQNELVSSTQQNTLDQQELQELKDQLQVSIDGGSEAWSQKQEQTSFSASSSKTMTEEITSTSTPSKIPVTEKEAAIIGLVSSFLHIHPFGASLEYIWSYLQKLEAGKAVRQPRDLESLLTKFPGLFKQQLSGVGVSLERKWTFAGFS